MTPTINHLTLWNRLHKPAWVSKIPKKKAFGFFAPVEDTNEVHRIINERVGISSNKFYKVGNSINLYRLAKHNAMRETGQFSLRKYMEKMTGGGGSDEHMKHFCRWIRKIERTRK